MSIPGLRTAPPRTLDPDRLRAHTAASLTSGPRVYLIDYLYRDSLWIAIKSLNLDACGSFTTTDSTHQCALATSYVYARSRTRMSSI